jgi:pyrroloquinoline quinone biosynthesis protein D
MSASASVCPVIPRGFRLQWEPAQAAHVLLYPEGMVKLNRSAGEILSRCTGELTLDQIVADLERQFSCTGLHGEVAGFLGIAKEKGWVRWEGDEVTSDQVTK